MANEIAKLVTQRLALKKALLVAPPVWNTPIQCAASTSMFLFQNPLAGNISPAFIDPEGIGLGGGAERPVRGNLPVSVSFPANLKWRSQLHLPLKMIFGTIGVPVLTDASYVDEYKIATDIEGLFYTLCQYKEAAWYYEFGNCKPIKLTLETSWTGTGSLLKVTLDHICYSFDNDNSLAHAYSSTNWTLLEGVGADAFYMNSTQASFQMLVITGSEADLSDTHEVMITDFTFNFERSMQPELFRAGDSGLLEAEPTDQGKRVVSGSFTIGRHQLDTTTDTWVNAARAGSLIKAKLIFDGPVIDVAPHSAQFNLYLPNITLTETQPSDPTAGVTFNFVASKPTEAVAGMEAADEIMALVAAPSAIMEEARITLRNMQVTDLLA